MASVDCRDYVFWYGGTVFISTVTKSSFGSISWATVLISSHRRCAKQNVACQHSQQTRDVDQCWSNSGPPSAALAQHPTSTGSTPRVCWDAGLAVHTAGGEYKPTQTQCLSNVGPASSVLASIHSALVSTSCRRTGMLAVTAHAFNQSWVKVDPPHVTLAHIQRGDKHNMVNQYWANASSAS